MIRKKNKKLTLYLDDEVIREAKRHARQTGSSVSDMVEKFLADKTGLRQRESETAKDIPSEFASFYGVIQVPDDFDEKRDIRDDRLERHR